MSKSIRTIFSCEKKWHLMAVHDNGTVSLIKDIDTKEQAEFMRYHLLGIPASPEEKEQEQQQYEKCKQEGIRLARLHAEAQGREFNQFDGHGISFSWTPLWPRQMKTVEIFQ